MTNFNIKNRTTAWFVPAANSVASNVVMRTDTDPSATDLGQRTARVTLQNQGDKGMFYCEASMYFYDPVTQGELDLSKYDFSVDVKECLSIAPSFSNVHLAVRQDNHVFVYNNAMYEGEYVPRDSYRPLAQSGLTQDFSSTNFVRRIIDLSTTNRQDDITGTPTHPNFVNGNRIRFGIFIEQINGITTNTDFEIHLDNFKCLTRETDPAKNIRLLGIIRLDQEVASPSSPPVVTF